MTAVEVKHGYGSYTHGCRCEVCKTAKAAYMSERRRAGRARAAANTRTATGKRGNRHNAFGVGATRNVVAGVTHGRYAYDVHGCRCRDCTTAKSSGTLGRRRDAIEPKAGAA